VRLYLFILIFFTVEEEGPKVKVFFSSCIRHVQRGGEGGLVFFKKLFLEFLSGYITKWGSLRMSAI
jgi:hypothetical protein